MPDAAPGPHLEPGPGQHVGRYAHLAERRGRYRLRVGVGLGVGDEVVLDVAGVGLAGMLEVGERLEAAQRVLRSLHRSLRGGDLVLVHELRRILEVDQVATDGLFG